MDKDLRKCPAGNVTPGRYDGEPYDLFLREMYCRAGIPVTDPQTGEANPLHAPLIHARLGDTSDCDRLPSPFPPEPYYKPLVSVQDWIDCAESCKVPAAASNAATDSIAKPKSK